MQAVAERVLALPAVPHVAEAEKHYSSYDHGGEDQPEVPGGLVRVPEVRLGPEV